MSAAVKLRCNAASGLLVLLLLAGPAATVALAAPDDHRDHGRARGPAPHGEFFDGRYNHGHYYPRPGVVVGALPGGYRPFYFHDRPFFFAGGVWYAPGPGGFIVTVPPPGLIVSVLPPFYTTVWLGGVPYYYADDVYYQWDPSQNAYAVVAPPAGAPGPGVGPPGPPPPPPLQQGPPEELYIYPKNGQTKEQQAQDRFECHSWATNQTGFDPTQPGGGVSPDQNAAKHEQYRRAMTACLEARGYSVQ